MAGSLWSVLDPVARENFLEESLLRNPEIRLAEQPDFDSDRPPLLEDISTGSVFRLGQRDVGGAGERLQVTVRPGAPSLVGLAIFAALLAALIFIDARSI